MQENSQKLLVMKELQDKNRFVNQRLEEHRIWLRTGGTSGKKFLAKGENLTGISFAGTSIQGAEFEDCTLDYAYLTELDPERFDKYLTRFERCSFRYANFSETFARNFAFVDCDFEQTDFSKTVFGEGTVVRKRSTQSDIFTIDANFNDADLRNTEIRGFGGGKWITSLHGANLTKVTMIDCNFSNYNFQSNSDLSGSFFRRCEFWKSVFSLTNGQECTFLDCNLSEASFWAATWSNTRFDSDCKLDGASFSDGNLESSVMEGVSAVGAFFHSTKMDGAILRLSNLEDATFTDAVFNNGDLSGSNLSGASIAVDFSGLGNTNFSGATMNAGKRCAAGSFGECI